MGFDLARSPGGTSILLVTCDASGKMRFREITPDEFYVGSELGADVSMGGAA